MPIKQIIEFQFTGSGLPGRYMYSYNRLTSRQTKNLLGKSSSGLFFTAKILQEAMCRTSPTKT